MKKLTTILFALCIGITASIAYSHPGRLDKKGCHKEKKTGKRHCHQAEKEVKEQKNPS